MFDGLAKKFQSLFSAFARGGELTEDNIADAAEGVRQALLEADVNYAVARDLMAKIRGKALGSALIKSVKPQQQFVKIVHDELVHMMGKDEAQLNLSRKPSVLMLCGLQGSGKTTHAAKLAHYLKRRQKKVLIAACDLQRPAAIEQLRLMAEMAGVMVFALDSKSAVEVAKAARQKAQKEKFDVLIVDTAGRLHVDEALMEELLVMKEAMQPQEVLFVASATTGQDAVNTARVFDEKIGITGSILTMMDSDARGGAALSIFAATQKPLKFEGIGEKIEDLQPFNPKSYADRVMGMGDVINLVRRARETLDEEESQRMEKKLKAASFNYEDYLKQMGMIRKMGSMRGLMKMMPGLSKMDDLEAGEDRMKATEAVILSMTEKERKEAVELDHSRRKRLAGGAGVPLDEVNSLVKNFRRMKQTLKKIPNQGKNKSIPDISELMGENTWR